MPELRSLQQAGKIRFLAASEAFASDNGHDALGQSLDAGDDWYDVLMVGHNPFNPSRARSRVRGHRGPGHRHPRHVRRPQGARLAGGRAPGGRRPGRARRDRSRRGRCGRSARASCWARTAPPRSPRRPTASPATSPAATWCSPAPDRSTTWPRTSPPSTARPLPDRPPPAPRQDLRPRRLRLRRLRSRPRPAAVDRFGHRARNPTLLPRTSPSTEVGGSCPQAAIRRTTGTCARRLLPRTSPSTEVGGTGARNATASCPQPPAGALAAPLSLTSPSAQGAEVLQDLRERGEGGVDVVVGGGPADREAQAAVGVDAHRLEDRVTARGLRTSRPSRSGRRPRPGRARGAPLGARCRRRRGRPGGGAGRRDRHRRARPRSSAPRRGRDR